MTKKATTRKKAKSKAPAATEPRFIEIVNWKKAQPRMKGKDNAWMKSYTSLLDHEAFANLDDAARVLLWMLWLYASRSGQHIFPASPKWLMRKIPTLNSEPDLRPLIEAVDVYGNPEPFIKCCGAPKPKKTRRAGTAAKAHREERQTPDTAEVISARSDEKNSSQKETRVEETRVEETRVEENRVEETRTEGETTGDGRVEEKEKKRRVSTDSTETPDEHSIPEPADPPEPDALGQEQAASVAQPAPGSDSQPRPTRRRRRATSALEYDRYDLQFGRKIFFALRLPLDPDDGAEGSSEVASFASSWHRIQQQFIRAPPSAACDQLGVRLLKEAHKIARGKSAKNKSAVWTTNARKIAASDKWSP